MEIISNETKEKKEHTKKISYEQENLQTSKKILSNEEVKSPIATGQTKHSRYKSLISRMSKENQETNKSRMISQTYKISQKNQTIDTENQSDLFVNKNLFAKSSKTPQDPRIQNKALYGYFFPNNYVNQSFHNNAGLL